jgi:hypothetical protein
MPHIALSYSVAARNGRGGWTVVEEAASAE